MIKRHWRCIVIKPISISLIIVTAVIILVFSVRSSKIKYSLSPDFKPKELTVLSKRASFLTTTQKVDSRIAKQVEQLIVDAEADGLCLVVSSGYRSYEYQEAIYEVSKDKDLVMKPGYSEHQTGLAVDFQACPMFGGSRDDSVDRLELTKPFNTLPEYQWLVDNADKYGISQTYSFEPWHWRFEL